MSKKFNMMHKVAVGAAVVALSLSVALPASAETKGTDGMATIMTPGVFCIWFGWC